MLVQRKSETEEKLKLEAPPPSVLSPVLFISYFSLLQMHSPLWTSLQVSSATHLHVKHNFPFLTFISLSTQTTWHHTGHNRFPPSLPLPLTLRFQLLPHPHLPSFPPIPLLPRSSSRHRAAMSSPSPGSLVWTSIRPLLKITFATLSGFVLAKQGMFPAAASKGFSFVVMVSESFWDGRGGWAEGGRREQAGRVVLDLSRAALRLFLLRRCELV